MQDDLYITTLLILWDRDSSIADEFEKGNFSINRTTKPLIDLVLEQSIRKTDILFIHVSVISKLFEENGLIKNEDVVLQLKV